MEVRWITPAAVERRGWSEVPELLERPGGFVWVDVERCDHETAKTLADQFGFHHLAVRDILERSRLAKIHAYPDHLFVDLHAPTTKAGDVDLVQLDLFVGRRYLVSTHGPAEAGAAVDLADRETTHIAERLETGRTQVGTPFELSYHVVSSLANRQGEALSRLARQAAALEERVRGELGDPVKVLEEMFLNRHELLSIRTIAAESADVFTRMSELTRMIPPEAPPLIQDLINRFERVRSMSDSEKEFAQGVIDFYQARTSTRTNVAIMRLALIVKRLTAVTVILAGLGAVAGLFGMSQATPALAGQEGFGFWAITLGAIAVAALTVAFLRRIDWL